jgi:hypothetical protein
VQVAKFLAGDSSKAAIVFAIGRFLEGKIDEERKRFFNFYEDDFENLVGPAKTAVGFYRRQLKCCRDAVDAWTAVGIRYGVVEDIRFIIGKMIWGERELGEYL